MCRLLFLAGWLAMVASPRPAQAQQVVCQQQFGQVIPQQGLTLQFRGGLTAISPDSALLYRTSLPNGSYNSTLPIQAGLVWVRRGSCDTARFAALTTKLVNRQGILGAQNTFIAPTRRGRVRVLNTVTTTGPDSSRLQLYEFTRRGQLRWVRDYASHNGQDFAQGLAEAPDRGAYLINVVNGRDITSLLKVDSLGREQWQRTYASNPGGSAVTGRTFSFVRPVYTARGNLLLAGTWNADTVGVNTYGLVLEVNQRGDSLTSRYFPAHKPALTRVVVTGVRALRSGGFLVMSVVDSAASSTYCGFTRLSADLQEQWTYLYRPANGFRFLRPELGQGLELADGSLLGAVGLSKAGAAAVRVLQLSATGHLLQEYTVPSPTFFASSLAPFAADSSFVLGGGNSPSGLASVLQVRIPGLRRVLPEPPIPPVQVFLPTRLAARVFPAQAYPNPAGTTLHVPYTLPQVAGAAELYAYDALGRVVLRQELREQQGEAEISVQGWPAGLYQLTLVINGQVQRQQRIAVTH
jgi:hypothetical protein